MSGHRHIWNRRGRLPVGTIRTCTACGVRQVKQPGATGGTSWQQPTWLRSATDA